MLGLTAQLAEGPDEGCSLGDRTHPQHDVRDEEAMRGAVQRHDALEHREAGAAMKMPKAASSDQK